MTVFFDTNSFRASHGKQPRGWGRWGFFFDDMREPTFTPRSMSFTEAKAWAKAEAKRAGWTVVQVAP